MRDERRDSVTSRGGPVLFLAAVAVLCLSLVSGACAKKPTTRSGTLCEARCDDPGATCRGEPCRRDCDGDPPLSSFREGWIAAYLACAHALPCGKSDDECLHAGFTAVDARFRRMPSVAACLERRKACKRSFDDDYCFFIAALTDEKRAEADRCRSLPCDAIATCLEATGAFNY